VVRALLVLALVGCNGTGEGTIPGGPSIHGGGQPGDFLGLRTNATRATIEQNGVALPPVNGGFAPGPNLPGGGAFTLDPACRAVLKASGITAPSCDVVPDVSAFVAEVNAMPVECQLPDGYAEQAILGCWGAACAGSTDKLDDATVDETNAEAALANLGQLCSCTTPITCLSETVAPCPTCP
jgi:hypothetical protein